MSCWRLQRKALWSMLMPAWLLYLSLCSTSDRAGVSTHLQGTASNWWLHICNLTCGSVCLVYITYLSCMCLPQNPLEQDLLLLLVTGSTSSTWAESMSLVHLCDTGKTTSVQYRDDDYCRDDFDMKAHVYQSYPDCLLNSSCGGVTIKISCSWSKRVEHWSTFSSSCGSSSKNEKAFSWYESPYKNPVMFINCNNNIGVMPKSDVDWHAISVTAGLSDK